jgi:squalene-hopene/tetraprenyl-beta-curcumene cyclase
MKLVLALVLSCVATTAFADTTADYLDKRANAWVKSPPPIANVACALSCHTTFPYLLSRRHLGAPDARIRAAFEARVPAMIAKTAVPFYGKNNDARTRQSHSTEAVLTAIALTWDDGLANNQSKIAREAVDHMWRMQRADGGFDWLNFGIDPWESSEDWGAAMALTLVEPVKKTAQQTKLLEFVRKRVASGKMSMHDRVTALWTGRLVGLLDDKGRDKLAADLMKTRNSDGGFSLSRWVLGTQQKSDAYATALAVLALCEDEAQTEAANKGLEWLRNNRAADGSYPGRSVRSTTARAKGYATDAATAYATLALATCRAS